MATRPVLRIFISSTAIDLVDYRAKVRDAVLGLEGAPIAMETFSALPADPRNESIVEQNLADLSLREGSFIDTLAHAEKALALGKISENQTEEADSLSLRAAAHFALGNIAAAEADFAKATDLEGEKLYSLRGIQQAECKLTLDDLASALTQTQANLEICRRNGWGTNVCCCNALLARLLSPNDSSSAAKYLSEARTFAEHSGDVELQLRCFQSACELAHHLRDLPHSIIEGEAGILLADTTGYGKYSIDIRLPLAEAYLAAGNFQKALQTARIALDLSQKPDCQYAWGQADALHLCGIAHIRLNETKLARQRLTAALAIRQKLNHPRRIAETRRALSDLGETGQSARA